jgi:hypothetical protein
MSNIFQEDARATMVGPQNQMYALPKNVKYSNVMPVGLPASSHTREFNTNNGATFSPTTNRTVRIPISAQSFLSPSESYLKFTVRNNGAQDWKVQGSAFSFFSQLRLETSDNQAIDLIDNFAPLMSLLSDCQLPKTYRNSVGSVTMGYGTDTYVASNIGGAQVMINPDLEGYTHEAVAGEDITFCIPLIGLLSSEKYLPLQKIRGSGLVLQMTLNGMNDAVIGTANAAVSWEISKAVYVGRLVNFDGKFLDAFDQVMAAGGIEIASPTYHNQVTNSQTGDYSVNISARSRSIKSVFAIQRSVAALTHIDTTVPRTDARAYDDISQYNFKIGSIMYPQKPIAVEQGDAAEAFLELHKALGLQLNHTTSGTIMHYGNYTTNEYTPAVAGDGAAVFAEPAYRCKFAIGMDFESMAPGSGLENGVDTASNNLAFSLDVKRTGVVPIQIDVYVLVDQFVKIQPDGSVMVTR